MKLIKYGLAVLFSLSSLFTITSSANATIGMYIPDSSLIGINCSDPYINCQGSFTINDKIWWISYKDCPYLDSGNHCPNDQPTRFYYSLSPEALAQQFLTYVINAESLVPNNNKSNFSKTCYFESQYCTYSYTATDEYGVQHVINPGGSYGVNVYRNPSACPGNALYYPGKGCATDGYTDSNGVYYETVRNTPASPTNQACCEDKLNRIFNDVGTSSNMPSIGYQPPSKLANVQRGDPIDIGTASVVESRQDLGFPIPFKRTYYSKRNEVTSLGQGWRHNFDKKLVIETSGTGESSFIASLMFEKENDEIVVFMRSSATANFSHAYTDQSGYTLTVNNTGYILRTPLGETELYDLNGHIIQYHTREGNAFNFATNSNGDVTEIMNIYGQFLMISYDANARISQITNSNNDTVVYTYINNQLATASLNNNPSEIYAYTNNLLTSITDELGNPYASFTYNTQGQAIQNARMLGNNKIEQHDYSYSSSAVYETQPNGNTPYYYTNKLNYINKVTSYTEDNKTYYLTYDNYGKITNYRDMRYGQYEYTYDSNGKVSQVTRPNGSVATITWDNVDNLPLTITETTANGNKTTALTYDPYFNLASKTVSGNDGSRTWNYTYAVGGKILTANNPDGSNLIYTYYPDTADISLRGLLYTVTNSLGQTMTFANYDRGNPTTITGFDGITQYYSYNTKGQIISETVGNSSNNYTYNDSGDLLSASMANGYSLTMIYDLAHRLTNISDNNGGSVTYTYDDTTSAVTSTSVSQDNNLLATKNSIVDKLGRITSEYYTNPSITTSYIYNGDDTVNRITDANGVMTMIYNDTSGRPYQINSPSYTAYNTYDITNNLTSTSINSSQITSFSYNTFGEMTQMISPDTGTHTYSRNITARTFSHTDNAGTLHTVQMDIGNRPTTITHTNGGTTLTESISYNTNNTVNTMTDSSGSTSYQYDSLNRMTHKTQTINGNAFTVVYAYNDANQLVSETYPSGLMVNYTYANGLLIGIGANSSINIVSNIGYQSMRGIPVSWDLFNSPVSVTYNSDNKLTDFNDTLLNQVITTDNIGNITGIVDSINNYNLTATYNSAYQITNGNIDGSSIYHSYDGNLNPNYLVFGSDTYQMQYEYGTNKLNYVYTPTNSATVNKDHNGNITTDHNGTFTYDLKNQMISANTPNGTGTYTFNSLGQRVSKTVNGVTTYFIYNERHQLIGEYDSSLNPIAEHIYFGQRPVALSKNNQLYAVHTDYLGTPRIITDSTNTVQWKWLNKNVLGNNLPTVSNIDYNLRFAGQYFDSESRLHYNYYRTYDPSIGRYMQSDPIGLAGGANTYNYVGFNPLNGIDPLGLSKEDVYKIMKNFRSSVDGMVERKERLPTSWINRQINNIGHNNCEDQSAQLARDLDKNKFDDVWRFEFQSGFAHFWLVGLSSNPADPIIFMDPWYDSIGIGQRCANGCEGFLGHEYDVKKVAEHAANNTKDSHGWYKGWDMKRPLSTYELRKFLERK